MNKKKESNYLFIISVSIIILLFLIPGRIYHDRISYVKEVKEEVVKEEVVVEKVVKEKKDEACYDRETIVDYINMYAKAYQVDPNLALGIAWCESEYYQSAQNPDSSAEGVFQMIDGTWLYTMNKMGLPPDTSKTNIPLSIEAGIFLLSEEGVSHWITSKGCWGLKRSLELNQFKALLDK